MKKFLLSLFALVSVAAMASANTATLTSSALGLENAASVDNSPIKVNDDITVTFSKGSGSTPPAYYSTGSALRLYGGNTLTVKGADGVTITSAEFTFGSSNTLASGSVDNGTADFAQNPTVWTGSANQFVISNTATKGHARIEKIVFTYTGGTGQGGSGTTTPTPDAEAANLAEFAAGAENVLTTIKSDAVAVCQLGNNLWIKDNSGWMLVFGSTGQTYENGDVIPAGYQGKYAPYNNLPELASPANFGKGDKVTPIEPEYVFTGDADGEVVNSYIEMRGCTITAGANARTFTCDDTTGPVTLYTSSASFSVPTGDNFTVRAFVSRYKDNVQLTPVEILSGSGREVVATPSFNPASGTVTAGTKVTITCATADATIYYTLDGTTPNADSNVYSTPIEITEDVTIKALAVKEDMDDSSVATASYTVPVISDSDATFNFADPTTLSLQFADSEYIVDTQNEANKYVEILDKTFTSKGVSAKVTAVDASDLGTAPRIYYQGASSAYTLRVYKKAQLVITAPENNPITKITLEYANGTTSSKNTVAPTEGNWVVPVWTAPEGGVSEAIFKNNGTQQIKTITVTCKDALSGVEAVEIDNENAPVEYYNLQGVRVENPENGLYIRRQGNKVSKVIIR